LGRFVDHQHQLRAVLVAEAAQPRTESSQ